MKTVSEKLDTEHVRLILSLKSIFVRIIASWALNGVEKSLFFDANAQKEKNMIIFNEVSRRSALSYILQKISTKVFRSFAPRKY